MAHDDRKIEDAGNEGISRRRMLQRAGVVGAVAWSAPMLASVNNAAFAASPPSGTCNGCNLATPCEAAIACGGRSDCNCWVTFDGQSCFCGVLDSCSNHDACGPAGECAAGLTCITNCCGSLCYAPCGTATGASTGGPTGVL